MGLKEEIKKREPFASLEQEAHLNLIRTTGHLAAEFTVLAKAHGISPPQYNVLRILRGGGELPCSEIAERMVHRLPDITRLVDRLESAGLVQRSRTESDRRVVLVRVTPKGLELLESLDGPVQGFHARQFQRLTRDELRELIRLLELARS